MKKIYEHRYEIFLFIIEAVCMILELCASRILSPYFGDSNLIWTCIIGIILLSASIGNAIGGKLADNFNVEKDLSKAMLIASALILYIPVLSPIVLGLIIAMVSSVKVGAIMGTIILFLPSSLVFGTIPPVIMKLKLDDLENTGKTSGLLHSVSTLGSIVGTFLGGFFLVPNFGCNNILFVLAAVTVFTIILVGKKEHIKYMGLIVVIAIACVCIFSQFNNDSEKAVLAGEINSVASYDTQYSRVEIVNREEDGDRIRYMVVGNGCESATYIDEEKKYDLVVPYTKYYDLMYQSSIGINQVLMIGGGGYSYPKYCVSHHADTDIDVVEIDAQIIELAKKYFYLDDAIIEFNTQSHARLNLINDDGRVYINTSEKKYDAILNDAFTGTTPVESLTTVEAVQKIHGMLNPGGVYLSNVIGSYVGENSGFLTAEVKTIAQVFQYVYVVPCVEDGTEWNRETLGNNMVVASDIPLNIDGVVAVNYSAGVVLSDDYCPVDTLIPAAK